MDERDSDNAQRVETEMSQQQLATVDGCFEEGQYDSGIFVLDQLRSPAHKPSASHIRQLLYLALYSPTYNAKEKPIYDPTASPSKLAKQQKSALMISDDTATAAQRLLLAFAHTNTPEAVFRVIPQNQLATDARVADQHDAVIAHESLCITQVKSCWALLEEGFIEKTITAKPNGKPRARKDHSEDDSPSNSYATGLPSPVGKNVWPVLEWLTVIFERDEAKQADVTLRYSPLLLSQIPLPRDNAPRWEFSAPLDVVFYCLDQNDERRQVLGGRLMTLLINLSSTVFVDYPLFIGAIFSRISTPSKLAELFSSLPTSEVVLRFKIALCQRFIVSTSESKRPPPKPRQARAQPKARVGAGSQEQEPEVAKSSVSPSIASKHVLPTAVEIVRLIGMIVPSDPLQAGAKLELLTAYAIYQTLYTPQDPEWPSLLKNGEVMKKLNHEHDTSLLSAVVTAWMSD